VRVVLELDLQDAHGLVVLLVADVAIDRRRVAAATLLRLEHPAAAASLSLAYWGATLKGRARVRLGVSGRMGRKRETMPTFHTTIYAHKNKTATKQINVEL
jgi:hypothetical protein